jgi:hypothetical protein
MAEQQVQTQAATTKKGKNPLVWIALIGCGCLVLIGCLLAGIGVMCATSDEFKTEFKRSYCEQLEEQGMDPSEDPFGICD